MQKKVGNVRWTICALVFFATTINYLDRAVISLLKDTLDENKIIVGDAAYSNVEIVFKITYAIGLLIAGGIIDKMGTKKGYGWATGLWSLSAVGHALAKNVFTFSIARAALGFTEAGNFPAAIKTTAEWFPKKERALATGLFNSGANIGAIVAPLTVPFIAVNYGWEWAFVATGLTGFIWLIVWKLYYHTPASHPKITPEELAYINSDLAPVEENAAPIIEKKYSWFKLLGYKQTWAFVIGKFLTDPIWWFYLFWLPDFLKSQYHLTKTEIALPVAAVYTLSVIGSIGGGWIPLKLISKQWPVFRARKTSMLMYAFLVVPILFAQYLGSLNMWLAVLVIGIAAAAHQAWSANIFTTVSDMFPKQTVGSVTGIGGMFGAIGGIFLSLFVQKNLFVYYREIRHIETAYYIMFAWCALAYLLAWLIMHLLVPKVNVIED
jgi:ACS family hexuronate transporter-like MFS transporter